MCASYDNHFVFALSPSISPILRLEDNWQSNQVVMIIKMPFVLICVSVALLYLNVVTKAIFDIQTVFINL